MICYSGLLLLLHCSLGHCTPKASFLDRVITDQDASSEHDYDQSVYDSDVNLPGVHYPKLPYTKTLQQGFRLGYDEPRRNGLARDVQLNTRVPMPDASPYFNRQMQRNITVQAGRKASLLCKVEQLAGKSVSWMRLADLHVLTIGRYKYSTDKRFDVHYQDGFNEWKLVISDAHYEDAGLYECQISTKPILSFVVNLNVVDYYVPPPVENGFFVEMSDQTAKPKKVISPAFNSYIINAPDIYVYQGSLANLTCVVNHGSQSLEYILWYHKNEVVTPRKGLIEVQIMSIGNGTTTSHLLLIKVQNENAGAYTCKPSNDNISSAMLHVLHEELQAAMQSNEVDRVALGGNVVLMSLIFWATFS